ncbi:MAG: hypothetical protein WA397_16595 [Roseiarcus sp.]
MPPARLNHVMLLPERSNWQARVHDKFEGSTSGFGQDREDGDAGIDPQQACLPLAPRVADEGIAIKLSNWRIAQFSLQLLRAANPGATQTKNSLVQEMFPDARLGAR